MGVTWTPLSGRAQDIALEVLLAGPLTRLELADRLDLSAGSLTRLTKPLLAEGFLIERDEPVGNGQRMGRPQRPLDVPAGAFHFVGVKVTSTRLFGVVTTLKAEIVHATDVAIDSKDPGHIVAGIAALVRDLTRQVGHVEAVGVTVGGEVRDRRTVVFSHILGWRHVPLADLIAEATGLPTVVDNDITGLTESESWFGEGRGLEQFALVTIGAGIGYSYVVRRHQVSLTDAGLGAASHVPLDPTGPVCRLGHRGCALAWLSSGSIAGTVSTALGRTVTYQQALDLAEQHDPAAARIVGDSARQLGVLISMVASLTMPEAVLLGGEGVRLATVGKHEMEEGITKYRDPQASAIDIRLRPSDFTEWARGAAVVAIQDRVLGRV